MIGSLINYPLNELIMRPTKTINDIIKQHRISKNIIKMSDLIQGKHSTNPGSFSIFGANCCRLNDDVTPLNDRDFDFRIRAKCRRLLFLLFLVERTIILAFSWCKNDEFIGRVLKVFFFSPQLSPTSILAFLIP